MSDVNVLFSVPLGVFVVFVFSVLKRPDSELFIIQPARSLYSRIIQNREQHEYPEGSRQPRIIKGGCIFLDGSTTLIIIM